MVRVYDLEVEESGLEKQLEVLERDILRYWAAKAYPHMTSAEEPLVVGFDTRLAGSTRRTETFRAYLRRKASLMDDQFEGARFFLRKVSSSEVKTNPVERTLHYLLSAAGKFLSF